MSKVWVGQWVEEDRGGTLKRMESRSRARPGEAGILFLFECSGVQTDLVAFPWNGGVQGGSAIMVSISSHTHGSGVLLGA